MLAARIPNAEFVELGSRNHVLIEDEPAWQRFCDAVLEFTGRNKAVAGDPFVALSPREREVLALLADGLSNADIATQLGISDKTVRNHVSKVFRQARRLDPRAGDRLRARSRVSLGATAIRNLTGQRGCSGVCGTFSAPTR